jgi:SagB-type dehydrogenase family enzyme
MTAAAAKALTPAEIAFAYHKGTKHSLERYAAGPETLDWDDQPNPFREFAGCARAELPFTAARLGTSLAEIYAPDRADPAPLTIGSVSALLELSMGLSAWKEYGSDRWALRCNPSSGNLHPTEAYVVCRAVPGLDNGLYHYVSRDHALERRCSSPGDDGAPPRLLVGLSSIHWREAWKYGGRAFRYCQLDIGHALGAFRYAAGALGWSAKVLDAMGSAELQTAMGLDRAEDFAGVEPEDAELLIAIDARPRGSSVQLGEMPRIGRGDRDQWRGSANRIDRHPLYRWPIIDEVSLATRGCNTTTVSQPRQYPPLSATPAANAADLILGRRSAQRFDAKTRMSANAFYRLLDCLLARPVAPWDVWDLAPSLHPVFFVHRVEGLQPGVYALPRRPDAAQSLRERMRSDFEWRIPEDTPAHLPFFRLLAADCRSIAKTVSCHQAIASDGCLALSMLSEFEAPVAASPWRYRQLHWEAGLIGHVLYLEAEAAGLRGTGVGCYFNDAMHSLLGLAGMQFQALYHFTVGRPLTDNRITTLPAYPDRQERRPKRNTEEQR